jgi:dipeptidyl-peptidase-4
MKKVMMIKAGVKYDSEFYPNRNHGIGDRAATYHLYRRMTDYLLDRL